jgi:predicted phosphoadenosine phosphosulfate sulfurtransferase
MGIPMQADEVLESLGKVPSYRRICKAILKNDMTLSSLGFSKPNCEIYNSIKKEEILRRSK